MVATKQELQIMLTQAEDDAIAGNLGVRTSGSHVLALIAVLREVIDHFNK